MAVDDQPDQPIPVTMSVALEPAQHFVHLGLAQVLPDPVGVVPCRPFEPLVALRTILAGRSRMILPDIAASPDHRLIA